MKKNILFVINSLTTGGAERQVVSDANMLVCAGYEVTIAYQRKGVLGKALEKEVNTHQIKYHNEILALLQMMLYLKRTRFDIVFAHMFWAHKVAALPSHLTGHKYVFFEHGLGLGRKWFHLLLLKKLDRFATKIATVSEAKRSIKIDREKAFPRKLIVLPNSFTSSKKKPKKEGVLLTSSVDAALTHIVFVGRFSKVKQLHLLLDVAKILVMRRIGFHFTLCGNGSEFNEIRSQIDDLNLGGLFTLTGHVADPYDYLQKGDIFVLPSRVEDFSVALLEAGYAGLPAIAFDVGGNGEIIVDGETGFLIQPYDVESFADKLVLLINDDKLRRQMGEKFRQRVLTRFSPEKRAECLMKLINSL